MKKNLLKKLLSICLATIMAIGILPVSTIRANVSNTQGEVYYGDVNDDNQVDSKDVTTLRRYLAGGWDVTINQEKADVNGDSKVDSRDVTMLRRYLAGGWGVTLPKKPDDVISDTVPIDEEHFPDEAFRNYVSKNIDENGDGVLSTEEQAVTSINGAALGIKDFTGIELFKDLLFFDCSENWLTNIDLSKNTRLESLYASYNSFESLDLSNNVCLKVLTLYGFGFRFDTLDLCENSNLTELHFNDSSLTIYRKVRLSKENYSDSKYRAFLQSFDENQDGFLDYDESHSVKELDLNGLNITSVTMFNMFDELDSLKANDVNIQDFNVSGMKVKKLDLSSNPNVEIFWSPGNGIEELNVDNTSICDISIYNNYNLKRLAFSNVPDLKRLDCDNNGLIDLNINDVTGLKELVCSRNKLTTLDLSNNTNLMALDCSDNQLSELNVSSNKELTSLDCSYNQLTSLDLRYNTKLLPENVLAYPLTYIIGIEETPEYIQGDMPYHYGNKSALRKPSDENYETVYTVKYSYDQEGRVIGFLAAEVGKEDTLEASYEYSESGINTKTIWEYSDGTQYLWEYDENDRLIHKIIKEGVPYKIEYSDSEINFDIYEIYNIWSSWEYSVPLTEFVYTYDENGMVTGIVCQKFGTDETITALYEYDDACNIKTIWNYESGRSITWDFDEIGNIINKTEAWDDGISSTYDGEGKLIKAVDYEQLPEIMAIGYSQYGHAWEWTYVLSEKSYEYDDNGKIIKIVCKRLDDGRSVTASYKYQDGYHVMTEWVYSEGNKSIWEIYYDEDGALAGYKYCDSFGNYEIYDSYMVTYDEGSYKSFKPISSTILNLDHYNDGYITIPYGDGGYVISSRLDFSGYEIQYQYDENTSDLLRLIISDTESDAVFKADYEYTDGRITKHVYEFPDGNKEELEFYPDGNIKSQSYINYAGDLVWEMYDTDQKLIKSIGRNLPSYALYTGDEGECGWGYEYMISLPGTEANYLYDEEGRIIEIVCNDLETSDVTLIEYEYDDVSMTKRTITYPSGQTDICGNVDIDENNFPDEIFRRFVKDNYDEDGNGILSIGEIRNVRSIECAPSVYAAEELGVNRDDYLDESEYLDAIDEAERSYWEEGKGIKSFKGIEFFSELVSFSTWCNQLTELNLCGNKNITNVHCTLSNLEKCDISECKYLERLTLAQNMLTNIDVTNNFYLESLFVSYNELDSIDVSDNINLQALDCGNNKLKTLDVSYNTALSYLSCDSNQLEELNLEYNTELYRLFCQFNLIKKLDMSNTKLSSERVYSDSDVELIFPEG